MKIAEIRQKYLDFYQSREHAVIPRANLVPKEDPTTLFTGSGMQPIVPYLLGETHPNGTRLVDSQTCFRAEDIDEVGDNRHTTYFEMLGNWSLGNYFKAEQLSWFWEFLTAEIGLDPKRLYVTVFQGDKKNKISKDTESAGIWQELFQKAGIEATVAELGSEADGYARGIKPGERIFYYDAKKNWWSRAGIPENMPEGEPGGPDSEVFYEFTEVEHDPKWGEHCHPNCDCGRFVEIGNSVFMQYQKQADGSFCELPQRNVDFGGGLERIGMASINDNDIFRLDNMWPIVEKLQDLSGKVYDDQTTAMRVIADHLRAVVWLANDGVVPSNTRQGYVMRRFVRRTIRRGLELGIFQDLFKHATAIVVDIYKSAYPDIVQNHVQIERVLDAEEKLFRQTLKKGLKEFNKLIDDKKTLDGVTIFRLYDTYGFPSELSVEEAEARHITIADGWQTTFDEQMSQQKDRSRTASAGMFKGGLMDNSAIVTRYHTATHLMYRALKNVLGDHVTQRGSNITHERLRFDFSHHEKMTPEQIQQVEQMVNEAIAKDYPVSFMEMPTNKAFASGAIGAFGDKYGDEVRVYTVGDPAGDWYSREICGGPHVGRTGEIGKFKIVKEESSSAGVRRIKAIIE